MPEPVTTETPRDYLEAAERIPEPSHEELAFALGRLLVWMLDGGKLTRIGQRVIITAYKLRPDTIHGATLAQIARRHRYGRSQAANLARKFTRTFGVKGLNDKASALASARYRAAWRRAHPHAKASSQPTQYLWLINMFVEWVALMEEAHALPDTPEAKQRMRREFEPLAQFIERLEDL
jgi:hypothetical protein